MGNRHFIGLVALLFTTSALSAADETLRVVPQLSWGDVGVASPDGLLFATGMGGYSSHSVKLVSKGGVLLWTIQLAAASGAAFSPDGKYLAACGAETGVLLDLKSCEMQSFPAFRGTLVEFTRDSQQVLIVRRPPRGRDNGKEHPDEGLFIYDLRARQIARFPVEMDMPHVVEALPDGKTIRVRGVHGDPMMQAPDMGKAVETIHLDSGKTERDWGPAQSGWMKPDADPRDVRLPTADYNKTLHGRAQPLYWNDASGLCVEYGIAWDIRHGRFLHDCGKGIDPRRISGFLGPDAILVAGSSRRKSSVVLVELETGQVSDTSATGGPSSPGPDGKSFVVIAGALTQPESQIELYHLPQKKRIYAEENVSSFAWSRDGKFLACTRAQSAEPLVRVVSVADGKFEEISLANVKAQHISKKKHGMPFSIDTLELDDSGQRLAVGMGTTEVGVVAIVNCKTHQVETVLDGFPIWVDALRFVGPDRLLTETWNGRVQLWDLGQHKPLWTAETGQECKGLGHVDGSPYVVCGSWTMLRLEDGKAVYRQPLYFLSDKIQPQLIGRSTWALDAIPESFQFRLVDIATGSTALTFCALPDDQWIIYTPSGDWDGSAHVHDWVKFCDGLMPVLPDQAERRHRRDPIEAVLKQVFPQP